MPFYYYTLRTLLFFRYFSLKDKFKEIDILTLTSQYIYENISFVKKNSNIVMTNINTLITDITFTRGIKIN